MQAAGCESRPPASGSTLDAANLPHDSSNFVDSSSPHFRQRRHAKFMAWLDNLPRPLSILDVGGTALYWRRYGIPDGATITLLNRGTQGPRALPPNMSYIGGDACAMPQFADGQFDLAFSNSVIEHVGTWQRQQAMAAEIARVGRAYWVQTPARSFPLEPHYLLPWFQFWPGWARDAAIRIGIRCGVYPPRALQNSRETRLLNAREMTQLFPAATLWRERIGPLVKSYVAHT